MITQVVAVSAGMATLCSLFFGMYLLGRRSKREEASDWRGEYEACNTKAARLEATLVEKDILIASKDEALAGQGKRLAEKDLVITEMGGTRVAELLVTMQEQNLTLFSTLTASFDNHEARAAERHTEIARFLRNLNGKD